MTPGPIARSPIARSPLTSRLTIFVVAALLVATASGCATAVAAPDDGKISIVASTDVYGSLADSLGGDLVAVTSIIDDPSQDPHSYEANARVQLELSRAELVIENGGGYDDFVDTLLKGANNDTATVLTVSDISGYAEGDGLNEHFWYDFPTVKKVVDAIVADLSARDSANAATFATNGDEVKSALDELIGREAALKADHAGVGVAITEPVPLYLLEASGLVNRTPSAFSEAIEEGTDVAPAVLQETLEIFRTRSVSVFAYNEQTSGPETEKLMAAAMDAGIPVVGVTETLPEGDDYLGWMSANLDAMEKALS